MDRRAGVLVVGVVGLFVVDAGAFLLVGGGPVGPDGGLLDEGPPGGGPADRQAQSGDGASLPPATEQSLRIDGVVVDRRGDDYELSVRLANVVRRQERGGPAPAENASVVLFNSAGERACEASTDVPVPPNESVAVNATCENLPVLLATRFDGDDGRCQWTGGRHRVEMRAHEWGYLGQNDTGHQWTVLGDTGCGSYLPVDRAIGYATCQQREHGLDLSGVPDPKPWLHERYSAPATNVTYSAAVVESVDPAVEPANRSRLPATARRKVLAAETGNATSGSAWFAAVSALEDREIATAGGLPSDSARHVAATNTHTTNCWPRISRTSDVGPATLTDHDGRQSTALHYRIASNGTTRSLRLTRTVSYSRGSFPETHRHVSVRSIDESAIERRKFGGSDTLWTRASVDGVNRSIDEVRYSNVSDVPDELRRAFVRADRNGTSRERIYVEENWQPLYGALDDKDLFDARHGYYPCGVGFVDCKTNEHSLILKKELYFAVEYRGNAYYVELVADPHARDEDGTDWEGR